MSSKRNPTCSVSLVSDRNCRNVEAALGGKVCPIPISVACGGAHEFIRVIHTSAFSSMTWLKLELRSSTTVGVSFHKRG